VTICLKPHGFEGADRLLYAQARGTGSPAVPTEGREASSAGWGWT